MIRERRRSIRVNVGGVAIGGGAPIVVQSMTNTSTEDVSSTTRQAAELAAAGAELIRITVNSEKAAEAVPQIAKELGNLGIRVPLIGDFHYNGHLLLEKFPDCARALAKYRINPGNVGIGKRRDENFRRIIELAISYDKPVRIGVNWGSLDRQLLARLMDENNQRMEPKPAREVMLDAMVRSALESAQMAREYGLPPDHIVLSAKLSSVQDVIEVYRRLAAHCEYALHLGLTEAGMGMQGIVASTAALAVLLQEGIGDTIRVSLTPAPGGDRCEEVYVAQHILQSLGIRSFQPQVFSCPGCGRTASLFFQEMAERIQRYVRERMPHWKKRYRGIEELKIAVMGCVVNGPGESRHANIGISLPGAGEEPRAPVYADGQLTAILQGEDIPGQFIAILENYLSTRCTAPDEGGSRSQPG